LREILDVFERTLLKERASAQQNASDAGKVGGKMKDLAFGEFSAAAFSARSSNITSLGGLWNIRCA